MRKIILLTIFLFIYSITRADNSGIMGIPWGSSYYAVEVLLENKFGNREETHKETDHFIDKELYNITVYTVQFAGRVFDSVQFDFTEVNGVKCLDDVVFSAYFSLSYKYLADRFFECLRTDLRKKYIEEIFDNDNNAYVYAIHPNDNRNKCGLWLSKSKGKDGGMRYYVHLIYYSPEEYGNPIDEL